jgi:Ca2+-binding RTX toxin-like protein
MDTVSSADREGTVGIFLSLGGTVLPGDNESEDRITAVENADGCFSFDHILGDARANRLQGLGGDDSLDGAGGDDTLLGGLGDDALFGRTGRT